MRIKKVSCYLTWRKLKKGNDKVDILLPNLKEIMIIRCWWLSNKLWSTLVQVMTWCLKAPSHYLNQCWLLANWTLCNKLQWNFNQNTNTAYLSQSFLFPIPLLHPSPFCIHIKQHAPPRGRRLLWDFPFGLHHVLEGLHIIINTWGLGMIGRGGCVGQLCPLRLLHRGYNCFLLLLQRECGWPGAAMWHRDLREPVLGVTMGTRLSPSLLLIFLHLVPNVFFPTFDISLFFWNKINSTLYIIMNRHCIRNKLW